MQLGRRTAHNHRVMIVEFPKIRTVERWAAECLSSEGEKQHESSGLEGRKVLMRKKALCVIPKPSLAFKVLSTQSCFHSTSGLNCLCCLCARDAGEDIKLLLLIHARTYHRERDHKCRPTYCGNCGSWGFSYLPP